MSLLLDALKKAALEKQNADSVDKEAGADDGLGMRPVADLTLSITDSAEQEAPVIEELELDDDLELEHAGESRTYPVEEEPYAPPVTVEGHIIPTPSTVSDEALQLLIHKTNHEHRKSRLVTWGGVAVGALILLSLSGFYYYSEMIDEIDSMHRKHQIALATLKSKTRIEENLTSLAVVPDSETQDAGSRSSVERKSAPPGNKAAVESEAGSAQRSGQVLSV